MSKGCMIRPFRLTIEGDHEPEFGYSLNAEFTSRGADAMGRRVAGPRTRPHHEHRNGKSRSAGAITRAVARVSQEIPQPRATNSHGAHFEEHRRGAELVAIVVCMLLASTALQA
jgi:hypothetical protein